MEMLAYASVALPYTLALLLGLLIPLCLLQTYRNLGFGIGVVAILFTFETFLPGFEGIQIGIRLYVPDIATGLVGMAALLRFALLKEARPRLASWYVYLFAVFLSLGIGLATLGSGAGVAARPYFYAVVLGSYALSFPGNVRMVRQLVTALVWLALMLLGVVVYRWIVTYVPIPDLLPETGRFSSVEASLLRVIPSQEAIILAQVVVLGLFYAVVSPSLRWLRPFLPALFLMVVALQHRSVWLAFIAALGARFSLPQAGRKATAQIAAMALVVVAVAIPLALSGKVGGATEDISRSADRAVAMSDTADARLGSWKFILDKWSSGGARALAIGLPMGTSIERSLAGGRGEYTRVSFQAHNYYVQTVFNTGFVGISASLFVYFWVLLTLRRGLKDAELADASGAMLLLTVIQMVYYLTYGINYMQALILGVAGALALAVDARRKANSSQEASVGAMRGKVSNRNVQANLVGRSFGL